ncbi:hypothetical protein CEUSTIGMA_g2455.t1 [Chlamydomonas eustigma]|uniref:arginyltransferase n=1 Tax=Chlamydomonas eustigma TaxID=1157962 RepID=A0A250WWC6_9CHLO|nr:hypothetical protein CEUSTIGMA_g2455.t1 [Chlamydomonas eustigma]|eukprot:GAX75009.1 hypothetical protein CEUSTIGMA_g2455.t1 [Chlamydomonas eustigma]
MLLEIFFSTCVLNLDECSSGVWIRIERWMLSELPETPSIILDAGSYKSSCGYCKSESSLAHGMLTELISVSAYQDLIDVGWRRSGTYLYKPLMPDTCCSLYTIRLDAPAFQPTKEQRKLIRKWGINIHEGQELRDTASKQTKSQDIHESCCKNRPSTRSPHGSPGCNASFSKTSPSSLQLNNPMASQHLVLGYNVVAPDIRVNTTELRCNLAESRSRIQSQLSQALRECLDGQHDVYDQVEMQHLVDSPPLAPTTLKQRKLLGVNCLLTSPVALTVCARCVTISRRHSELVSASACVAPETPTPAALRDSSTALPEASIRLAEKLCERFNQLEGSRWASFCAEQQQQQQQVISEEHDLLLRPRSMPTSEHHGDLKASQESIHWLATSAGGHINFSTPSIPSSSTTQSQHVSSAQTSAVKNNSHNSVSIIMNKSSSSSSANQQEGANIPHQQKIKKVKAAGCEVPPADERSWSSTYASAVKAGSSTTLVDDKGSSSHAASSSSAVAPLGCTASTTPKLDIVMVPAAYDEESFQLYKRYQVVQHGDDPEEVTPNAYKRFLVDTPLIREEPSSSAIGKSRAAEDVVSVEHQGGDDSSRSMNRQRLSLMYNKRMMPDCGYGSFHQQYRLNGKLVAVGVVDVLPRCLSSVYFFWDPGCAMLSLGKLSALKEIEWVQQAARMQDSYLRQRHEESIGSVDQGLAAASHQGLAAASHQGLAAASHQGLAAASHLRYYYMGFYIHACHKMRYKAGFQPSDLLCPESKVWVRMTPGVISALDTARYLKLSSLPDSQCFPNLAAYSSYYWRPQSESETQDQTQESSGLSQAADHTIRQSVASRKEAEDLSLSSINQLSNGPLSLVPLSMAWVMIEHNHMVARWKDLAVRIPESKARKLAERIQEWLSLVGPAAHDLVYSL